MRTFCIECDGEALPAENVAALENALQDFVETDVTLVVECTFVSETEIHALNRETRGVDKVTDVLSYPALDDVKGKPIVGALHPFETDEEGRLTLGSVAICVERAKEQAVEYGHSLERELHYLLVHGIMHCLGYDHMTDGEKEEMREREEYILGKLGITRE